MMLCTLLASAQKEGVRIVRDNWQQLQVEFTPGTLKTGVITLDGETFSTLAIEGYQQPLDNYGSPSLPTFSKLIEVPLGAEFEVTVSDAEYDTLASLEHRLMPVQLPRRKSDTTEQKLFINHDVYSWNAFVGQPNALVEAVGIARDRRLARLQFSPVRYNPVSGKVIVCRHATVTINYQNADKEASLEMFERYHTPAFNSGSHVMNNLYPKAVRTAAPTRLLIVAHSMFRGYLDEFVAWKRLKGFLTDVVYTDDPAVGSDTNTIAAYIASQYTNATLTSPAPTYLLLVGDVQQIPVFHQRTGSTAHVTDLYYTTWTTGDNIPDCYHGRFSAQTVAQLIPQIQKTLMYEQYTFSDPTFLDRAVMVAGVDRGNVGDAGYTYGDPTMDYAIINYVNGAHGWSQVMYFKNNTSIVPSGTNVTVNSSSSNMAATVRGYYNQGAGFINYTAHGGSTGWGTPSFGNSHVEQMTNHQKFGLMIGNCCQTNMFGESTCFGEALLRKNEYAGALGYIGGSDYTYWGEDFYWAVGVRTGIGPSMSMAYNSSNLGAYDHVFHTHGEDFSQWATTQGAINMMGNMSVQSSTSGIKLYYWEIYHLMGDPSVMPYMTQANTMTIVATSALPYGTATTLAVMAAPYAYVALTDTVTGTLIAAAYADGCGAATLPLPADLMVGTYILAASAPQYRTELRTFRIIPPDEAFPMVNIVASAPFVAGDTVALTLLVANLGDTIARNINIELASSSPHLTFSTTTVTLDSLAAGDSIELTARINVFVADGTPDNTFADLSTTVTWTGATLSAINTTNLRLYAPVLSLTFSPSYLSLLPGDSIHVTATLTNGGHAATRTDALTFVSATPLFTALPSSLSSPFSLGSGSDTSFTLTLYADSQLPQGVDIAVDYNFISLNGTLPVFIGQTYVETFEDSTTHIDGWFFPAAYPWAISDVQPYEGAYCLGSTQYMGHNDTSEVTLTFTTAMADSVSFHYRVSSEENYDKFRFYIDGIEKFVVSGEVEWSLATYPVTAGTHTLTFRYTKDYSVSNGSDRAWIDNLVLPHQAHFIEVTHYDFCTANSTISVEGHSIDISEPGIGGWSTTLPNGTVVFHEYEVHPTYNTSTEISACDSYLWKGEEYTASTVFIDTLSSAYGCDSIVQINLTVNHSSFGDTLHITTMANSYEWYGTVYTESGTYQQHFTNSLGCDSIVTIVLSLGGNQGIEENDYSEWMVEVYPNPTHGEIVFSAQVVEAIVYDMLGHEVLHRTDTQTLDLGSLPQGIYVLRLTLPGRTVIRRVVKQ